MLTRKDFLKGSATAALAATTVTGVALADEAPAEQPDYAAQVSETKDVDLLIIGAGLSGLAAGVQAIDDGFKVTIIDTIKTLERRGPEGLAGVGSFLQKEQGIDLDVNEIMNRDAKFFNYRLDPLTWKDMLEASGANIDWLAEKGVVFTGQVDNYRDMGEFDTFHWFPGDHVAWQYYSTPMADYFTGHGGEILFETTGVDLITDGDAVVGAYAVNAEGKVIQFNAKAVVLATGGCGGSQEEIAKRFRTLPVGRYFCDGYFTDDGSGLNMALKVGGVDVCIQRCFLGGVSCVCDDGDLRAFGATRGGSKGLNCCWVNQNGERYCNEASALEFSGAPLNAFMAQEECYSIFDAAFAGDLLDKAIAQGADPEDVNFFSGETLEELAAAIGADPEKLAATIAQYNEYVEAGEDKMFNKPAEYLSAKFETGPFFAARLVAVCHGMVGGLLVNRDFQVVRWDFSPIAGLYATGTESNMNYRETYTIEVPGTDACNTVYSGRRAAQHFAANA
ncbi:MAG: FAD-binding protein [Coriobacteriales bacterium]|nr:FAD-binding protein [Coriobacteriales bacterium]